MTLAMCLIMQACIREFTPTFSEYEDILVVDALITDESVPHAITLSRSYPLDKRNSLPEIGAEVIVVKEDGENWVLKENSGGIYRTDTSTFKAHIGEKYQLRIRTKNSEEFESDWVEILPVAPIDSLLWQYEERVSITDGSVTQGVGIYLYASDPLNQTRYYKWEFDETWEFRVPFIAEGGLPNRTTCWDEDKPKGIRIATTEFLAEDRLVRHPVYFITGSSNRLSIGYSLIVRQYALLKESFDYWDQLNRINYRQGSLYDAPPAQIPGNIRNLTNPGKPVLGYFQASGVATRQLFIFREELPPGFYVSGGFPNCTVIDIPATDVGSYYKLGYVLVSKYFNTQLQKEMAVLTNAVACVDCTVNGTNVKPSFWPR